MAYYDFIVKKEHHFLQNIFTEDKLKKSYSICDLKTYEYFERFIYVINCLIIKKKKYSIETKLEDIEDEEVIDFMENGSFETFDELFNLITQHKTKKCQYS